VKRPDLFIVGAQRCGTTALDAYLGRHPQIFMCRPKEPHHFCPDLNNRVDRFIRDRTEYLRLFEGATTEMRSGEASPFYLYSKRAPTAIQQFCPHASIVIMLRNPVDFLYSLYHERFYYGHLYPYHEDLSSFEEALDAEDARRQGRRLPKGAPRDPQMSFHLFYRDHARFAEQVKRYYDTFPREQIHVILYEDFTRNLSAVYRNLCDFLGVDASFQPQFERVNANKNVRHASLLRMVGRPNAALKAVAKAVMPTGLRRAVVREAIQLGTRIGSPLPMGEETRRRLNREFLPEVLRLSQVIGRDVSYWCRDAAGPTVTAPRFVRRAAAA